jgi:hypothetical protein
VDSPDNTDGSDVLGNKQDTEAGDSLTARTKPPLADSANNDWISDVVGSKLDTIAGNSLVARALQILGLHDVPAQDAVDNSQIRDVLGNKTDTVAGTSVFSRIQQILAALGVVDGFHDVPVKNAVTNSQIRDVLGNKTDDHDGTSVYSLAHIIDEHLHGASWVLPDRAAAITVTAGNGWAYGAESASLGTPADTFDVHWVTVVANNNAEFQLQLLVAGSPVAEQPFTRVGVFDSSLAVPIQMDKTAAGSITCQLASSVNGATAAVKVTGHYY